MAAVSKGIGWALIGVGAWVTTCGYMGVPPIQTLIKIIQNPSDAAAIIRAGATPLDGSTASGSSTQGGAVVSYAAAQIGKPYVYGGTGDIKHGGGFDCSGLTLMAWGSVGVKLPHSSLAQMTLGKKVSLKADLLPGDLVFPSLVSVVLGDHVQIWVGDGTIIEAPYPGAKVRKVKAWGLPSGAGVRATRPGG